MNTFSSSLFFAATLSAFASTGCLEALRVEGVQTSIDKPSNVAVYLDVTRDHAPVAGLFEKDFSISEDGQELTAEQTRQTLLPRDMVAVHRALLLVDMSGPIMEGDSRRQIAAATARFVTKAHASEPVTVFAFDGGTSLKFIGDFPQGTDEIADVAALSGYTQADPSSNLNSAVVEAMAELEARLMTAQKPIRVGTLVVFARGPDLAGRVSEDAMRDAVSDSKHRVYVIAVKDAPGLRPARLGKAGTFIAESSGEIENTFEQAGTDVGGAVNGYYLLSYCSPARAGTRGVRIKATTTDEKGQEQAGTFRTDFDATGFTSGCDPTARPRFVVHASSDSEGHDKKPDKPSPSSGGSASHSSDAQPDKGSAPADEGDAVAPPPAKPGYAQ